MSLVLCCYNPLLNHTTNQAAPRCSAPLLHICVVLPACTATADAAVCSSPATGNHRMALHLAHTPLLSHPFVPQQLTLQCVPRHQLEERTITTTAAEVKKNHKK